MQHRIEITDLIGGVYGEIRVSHSYNSTSIKLQQGDNTVVLDSSQIDRLVLMLRCAMQQPDEALFL